MRKNIEYLQMLGLTEYQSRILVVLFAKGKATALNISTLGSVPLTKIYQVLKELEYMGLISHSPGKPRIYSCPGAEIILDELIQNKISKIEILQKQKETQLEIVESLEFDKPEKKSRVHPIFLHGRYDFPNQISELKAGSEISELKADSELKIKR